MTAKSPEKLGTAVVMCLLIVVVSPLPIGKSQGTSLLSTSLSQDLDEHTILPFLSWAATYW